MHSTPSRGDVLASGRYDPEGEDELTAAAVYAVADVEGGRARDATSPLLYDCVDVAALERLRSPPRSARGRPLSGT